MSRNLPIRTYVDCTLDSRGEVFSFIADLVSETSTGASQVIKQLEHREELGSTMIAEHVLLPHIESPYVRKSEIIFIRLGEPIQNWDETTKDIQLLIVISLAENESVPLKKDIAGFTRTLADEEFVQQLITMSEQDILKTVNQN
ncbi:PTS sugar transporter subunit IIA [Alkalihalobacillus sp. FSL R5-0424]